MTDIEGEWRTRGMSTLEEVPYRKCPNCGEYQFRTIQRKERGLPIIGTTKWLFAETCKNCRYTRKEWEEEA